MSELFRLSDAQMARLEPYFPKSHGKPWVDDKRRAEMNYLDQSQWFTLSRCAERVWATQDSLQPLDAVDVSGWTPLV